MAPVADGKGWKYDYLRKAVNCYAGKNYSEISER